MQYIPNLTPSLVWRDRLCSSHNGKVLRSGSKKNARLWNVFRHIMWTRCVVNLFFIFAWGQAATEWRPPIKLKVKLKLRKQVRILRKTTATTKSCHLSCCDVTIYQLILYICKSLLRVNPSYVKDLKVCLLFLCSFQCNHSQKH